MKRHWGIDELVEHWTLLPRETELLTNKTGATRLGFAVLLKFFQLEASGHENVSAPLSLAKTTMVLSAMPRSSSFLSSRPTTSSSSITVGIQTVSALVFPLGRKSGPDMHARSVVPKKERLIGFDRPIDEVQRMSQQLFLGRFHPLPG